MATDLTPEATYQSLLIEPDQLWRNHFGEVCWMKQTSGGITECCRAESPCGRHGKQAQSRGVS